MSFLYIDSFRAHTPDALGPGADMIDVLTFNYTLFEAWPKAPKTFTECAEIATEVLEGKHGNWQAFARAVRWGQEDAAVFYRDHDNNPIDIRRCLKNPTCADEELISKLGSEAIAQLLGLEFATRDYRRALDWYNQGFKYELSRLADK